MYSNGLDAASRRWKLAVSSSVTALVIATATPAAAQCAPDPTQPNATTACTGLDIDGIRITTTGSTVQIDGGVLVSGSSGPAVAVEIPVPIDRFVARTSTILVAGTVDGGSSSGISVLTGSIPTNSYDYYGTNVGITVAGGAALSGNAGVALGLSPSNVVGMAYVTLVNAGTITGSGGYALLATDRIHDTFVAITNTASGSLGAINATVNTLDNAGLIDGGLHSAIDQTGSFYNYQTTSVGVLQNSGIIRSTSSGATIEKPVAVTNGGTIVNVGSGAAISGDALTIANTSTGAVTAGSAGTAIIAATSLNLQNSGRIDGNITITAKGSYDSSIVDSSTGTLNGNLTFGSGADVLIARYTGGRTLATGVTGTINGGDGIDTVRIGIASDTVIATPIDLASGFERLGIDTASGATTTLASGFVNPGTLAISGAGTLLNQGTLTAADQALVVQDYGSSSFIVNAGTIRTTAINSSRYAVDLQSANSFANTGVIDASSNGVAIAQGSFLNSGAITGAGTAVSFFGTSFANNGRVVSTGGTGVILSGYNSGGSLTNDGSISGATVGLDLQTTLVNTGTITSAGIGVVLESYGEIDNRANGVITGGAVAIGGVNAADYYFNRTVLNAGIINGDVRLGDGSTTSYGSNNLFFASPGGVLNGNLTLGTGDTLVTELVNTGTGAFAGITGSVTASNSLLRYEVRSEAAAVVGPMAGFQSVGYELYDHAAVTLNGNGSTLPGLTIAGVGSVDLNADIASTSQPLIQSTGLVVPGGYSGTPNTLSLTSRGALTLTHLDSSTYPYAAVTLGSQDSFDNIGTIAVREQAGSVYSLISAVAGGTVTNAGTISLDGAIGIRSAKVFTNTGSIVQIAGGAAAIGVQDTAAVINSGTIDVSGVAIGSSNYAYTPVAIINGPGGLLASSSGTAVRVYAATFTNAGTVTGTVDLGYQQPSYTASPTRSYASSVYTAAGGTISGNLLFGDSADLFIETGSGSGVSGTIDGGGGTDIFGHVRHESGTVSLDLAPQVINFENGLVQALGAATVATITATNTFKGNLYVAGDGAIVNQAHVAGTVSTSLPFEIANPIATGSGFSSDQVLGSFTNAGSLDGGVFVATASFTNSGTVSTYPSYDPTIIQYSDTTLAFKNSGTITQSTMPYGIGYPYYATVQPTVALVGTDAMTIRNSGDIRGGGLSVAQGGYGERFPAAIDFANTGTIASNTGAVALSFSILSSDDDLGGTLRIVNAGTISAQTDVIGSAFATAVHVYAERSTQTVAYDLRNSGTISATATDASPYAAPQTTAVLVSGAGLSGIIDNTADGRITASGGSAYAIVVADSALTLTNDGMITAAGSKMSTAVQTFDAFDNVIVNSGTIFGNIQLGEGADRIENAGTITGRISLGGGDDTFVQHVGSLVNGMVDGGDGADRYVVDTSGGTTMLAGSQITQFEGVTQTGNGVGSYSGTFDVGTIALDGGTLVVAAGQRLATQGTMTITGGDAGVSIVNAGRIASAVKLGAGDDSYTEAAGSIAEGGVDGGGGSNLYHVILAGDHSGIGARTNFQHLAITGTGTLKLALDQSFQSVALAGANLTATLGAFTIGRIDGSSAAEAVALDRDVAAVALGGGDDMLALGAKTLAGRYDGGDGNDALHLTAAAPVTLTGFAVHFESVALAGGALTVAGSLGSSGAALAFGDHAQALTVAAGGTLAGAIDLGAGDDSFTLERGGTLIGTVAGGAGDDLATLDYASGFTLKSETLTGFERLTAQGNGVLTLTGGGFGYTSTSVTGDLTIAADADLRAAQLTFGAADNRLSIAGTFTGSVAGGAGTNSIDVSGGTATFGTVSGFNSFRMSGGVATVADIAGFGTVSLLGGRLTGLAGSTITASAIAVGSGATFGSAGTVNGNISVAGTLSPGASPGTMLVNGNIAVANGSTSLFEITPSVSDKLVVNGTLSIAQGATLQLTGNGTSKPGTITDLIVASGGITGSYTNIVKPAALFGFLVQDGTRIRLAGEFLNSTSFSAPVQRTINYVNSVLVSGKSSAELLAAVPSLVSASGVSNPGVFGRLTPEAYASAEQITVGNGLTLSVTGRGTDFAPRRDMPGLFTFASVLGGTATLEANSASGTDLVRTNGYGFVGGLGFAGTTWSIGIFGGYLNNHQALPGLAVRTRADGAVAGVHGRVASGGFGIKTTVAYDGGNADTRRVVPGGSVNADYRLHGWTADAVIDYTLPIAGSWTVKPSLGATAVRATRSAATERGISAFALTVVRHSETAVFVDGGMTFSGTATIPQARIMPYLSLGARYQLQGRTPIAIAGFGGGDPTLLADGAPRAPVLATATLGTEVALSPRLTLFGAVTGESGDADHRGGGRTGLRLAF